MNLEQYIKLFCLIYFGISIILTIKINTAIDNKTFTTNGDPKIFLLLYSILFSPYLFLISRLKK